MADAEARLPLPRPCRACPKSQHSADPKQERKHPQVGGVLTLTTVAPVVLAVEGEHVLYHRIHLTYPRLGKSFREELGQRSTIPSTRLLTDHLGVGTVIVAEVPGTRVPGDPRPRSGWRILLQNTKTSVLAFVA